MTNTETCYEDEFRNSLGESIADQITSNLLYLTDRCVELLKKGDHRSAEIVFLKGKSLINAYENQEYFAVLLNPKGL